MRIELITLAKTINECVEKMWQYASFVWRASGRKHGRGGLYGQRSKILGGAKGCLSDKGASSSVRAGFPGLWKGKVGSRQSLSSRSGLFHVLGTGIPRSTGAGLRRGSTCSFPTAQNLKKVCVRSLAENRRPSLQRCRSRKGAQK